MNNTIIIGSGPCGISAALYLKRANKNVSIISRGIGALKYADKIENYYGIESVSGNELYEKGLAQAEKMGIEITNDEIFGIEIDNDGFLLTGKTKQYKAKYVIIATGNSRKQLNIKGIKEFEGKGVSYCAVCDGFFYKNLDVAVVGNSEYALHEAKYLKSIANKVYILTNGQQAKFESGDFEVIIDKIKEIDGNELLSKVKLECKDLNVDGLFVALGSASSNDFAKKIGAEIIDDKVKVDENCQTSIENLFVGGDANGGLLQVNKAVYEGALCASAIIKKELNS